MSNIFDRKLLKQNQARFSKKFSESDFIFKEIAKRITEEISDLNINFSSVLEIGARDEFLIKEISRIKQPQNLFQTKIIREWSESKAEIIADEEFLPFKENSFDLILSNLNLHFVNDVPTFLIEIKKLLKKDGFFIASFFGGESLKELREVFYKIEEEKYGAVSPRISPFIHVKDAGMLMQKAGFSDSVANLETIEVSYPSPLKLFQDLRNMGQSNILQKRSRKFLTKKILANIIESYKKLHANNENRINATFDIITITGWKN